MTEESKHAIGKALGKVPSGVYVLTATSGQQSAAMMVSWVQQASFVPPALSIAMAKDRPVRKLLDAGGVRLALCGLSMTDNALMKKYARGIPEGQDPFDGVPTARTPGGAIYLTEALTYLECRLVKTCDFNGDHDLHIAEITAAQLLKDDKPFTHVRGNGFHY
jgi:3-hydroxy-9,10-secoandrosta-1,3,5(10)-triene-9,17-dione monooxygenase reductase component